MFVRRVSMLLSALALALMILAGALLQLGDTSGPPRAAVSKMVERVSADPAGERRACTDLDLQMDHCAAAVSRLYEGVVGSGYPARLRRLIAIKKRYKLEQEAARACHCTPEAPVARDALSACMRRPSCDDFARCVAESLEEL